MASAGSALARLSSPSGRNREQQVSTRSNRARDGVEAGRGGGHRDHLRAHGAEALLQHHDPELVTGGGAGTGWGGGTG